jgi:hypothetical protein
MLQIATFKLPEQQDQANEFLRTNKPDGVNYFPGEMIISIEDGTYPVEYQIVDLRNLVQAAEAAKMQQIIARGVLEMELDKISFNKNKGQWEEKSSQIKAVDDAVKAQDAKIAVVGNRITELQNQK